jgi:hypothetical protein
MGHTRSKSNVRLSQEEKLWFILVQDQQQGPFSLQDLKYHSQFTPDTLVRKKEWSRWIPARFVQELEELFKDEKKTPADQESDFQDQVHSQGRHHQVILAAQQDPSQFFLWMLILLIILFYTFSQFHH